MVEINSMPTINPMRPTSFSDVDLNDRRYDTVISMPRAKTGWRESIRSFNRQKKLNFVCSVGLSFVGVCAFVTRLITAIALLVRGSTRTAGGITLVCSFFPLIIFSLGTSGTIGLVKSGLGKFRVYCYGTGIASLFMTITSIILCMVTFYMGSYFDFVVNIGALITYSLVFSGLNYLGRRMLKQLESEIETESRESYIRDHKSSYASDSL